MIFCGFYFDQNENTYYVPACLRPPLSTQENTACDEIDGTFYINCYGYLPGKIFVNIFFLLLLFIYFLTATLCPNLHSTGVEAMMYLYLFIYHLFN